MIQGLLYIIQLLAIVFFGVLAIVFLILAIVNVKNLKKRIVFLVVFLVVLTTTLLIWNIDLYGTESTDREDLVSAFESNFGFKPPESIKEIKVKNFSIYDSNVHWMAFTYEPSVFNQILVHEKPLEIAYNNTPKYNKIIKKLKENCSNCPDWLETSNNNVSKIYFKNNFLNHSSSEYYLWLDHKEKMVYLEVSYFD
jgi:hypothetical protein